MPPQSLRLPTSSLRSTHLLLRTRIPLRSITIPAIQQQSSKLNLNFKLQLKLNPNLNTAQKHPSALRTFSSTPTPSYAAPTSSGKSQADLIVEELQELYETATDELEIATESTDSATIYAASDRESARDALNSLVVAYELYTSSEPQTSAERPKREGEGEGEDEEGRLVELSFDPVDVPDAVREEVRKRVGQRVREVRSAVEGLEGRVHD